MKSLRLIIALLLVGIALGSNAQVTRRTGGDARNRDKNKSTIYDSSSKYSNSRCRYIRNVCMDTKI